MATAAARNRAAVRSQLAGVASTRKLLRRIEPAAKNEMADILADEGQVLLALMRADTPVRTGALRAGLASRVLRKALRLRVGLVTKATNKKLFYAPVIEFGRKANTKSRGGAIAARPFIFKKRVGFRGQLGGRLNVYWEKVLVDAAQGVGDD